MGPSSPEALVEQLASLVMSIDADEAGLTSAAAALTELTEALRPSGGAALETAQQALGSLTDLRGFAPREALKAVSDAVTLIQKQLAAPPVTTAKRVTRDTETLELARDFLQESGDGLSSADEMLLSIESAGATTEKVNALFRVFHTIKGVAGFLELTEIVALAHSTESLMNEVRDGRCLLAGDALDLVFKATAILRTMLDTLKQACEAGVELTPHPEAPGLTLRLKEFLSTLEAEVGTEPTVAVAAAPTPPPAAAAATVPAAATAFAPLPNAPPPPSAPAPRPSAAIPFASAPVPEARASAPAPEPRPAPDAEAPAVAVAAPPAARPGAAKMRETVKVDLERVDSMVEMIGELIIVESMLTHSGELSGTSVTMRNTLGQLGKISRDLQNAAMRMRTVPVHSAFQKMARLTREVGRKAGKEVVLVTQGEGTEMDRAMVERLEDPLVHMVRNAVDHGIETPEARVAAGKPATGVLTLSASHKGAASSSSCRTTAPGSAATAFSRRRPRRAWCSTGRCSPTTRCSSSSSRRASRRPPR